MNEVFVMVRRYSDLKSSYVLKVRRRDRPLLVGIKMSWNERRSLLQTMSLVEHFSPTSFLTSAVLLVPVLVILGHLLPWIVDPHGLRSFPGPWLARFSDLWLGFIVPQGHRSEVVHELHEKYGELEQCDPADTTPRL